MLTYNLAIIGKVIHANRARRSMNVTSTTKMSSMTAILLAVSFSFLVLSGPVWVLLALVNTWLMIDTVFGK